MVTAVKEFQDIKRHAESIKSDELQKVGEASHGDYWRQGDIAIIAISEVPEDCEPVKCEPQLAPGTSQGSRHCLSSLAGVEMFRVKDGTPLDGPVFRCDREITVEHPEHGDVTLPAGTYGVIYQRQYAEELRRVQD